MQGTINLKNTIHNFSKQNLVGHRDGSDTYKCSCCGITGKRAAFSDYVQIGRARKGLF